MPKIPRSYLYISDSKVDALVPQSSRRSLRKLQRGSRKRETRLAVGAFGVQGESRSTVESNREPDRFQRLAVAEQLIRRSGEVGTMADHKQWIEEELLMKWGIVYEPHRRELAEPLAVLFIGGREGQVVALSGSIRHVLGYEGSRPVGQSKSSFWYASWDYFERRGSLRGLQAVAMVRSLMDSARGTMGRANTVRTDPFERALRLMDDAAWPTQRVRFFAERLMERENATSLYGDGPAVKVTIGTPLYVVNAGI